MAQLKDILVGAIIGVHNMEAHLGRSIPLHNLFMHTVAVATPVLGHLRLTDQSHLPETLGCFDHAIVNCAACLPATEQCSMCLNDCETEFMQKLGGDPVCEECVDHYYDEEEDIIQYDTPSIDTFMHDYEMEVC